MPPDDPLGRHGPSLENFLRKRPVVPEHKKQPCPYGQYSKSMEKLICLYFKTSQHIKKIYIYILDNFYHAGNCHAIEFPDGI